MKPRFAVILVALLFAAGAWVARAQNPPAPQPLTLEKITDDLYVILGDGGNAPVLLTDEGVILVDSKNERNHDDLVATVKTVTDKPITYVISTHAHADHTGGNRQLLHDAQVIGHVNVRAAMTKGHLPGSPPLAFTDQMSIVLGGKEVDLRYFGRCHTDGDTFVYFPADRVLATGDCFNTGNGRGLNPTGSQIPGFYADYTIGGSFLGFANAADAALKLDWDTVIPGHGPMTNRAGFLQWRAAVDMMTNRMRSMVREGRTKTEIEDMLVNEFKWERTGMPFRSVEGMIAELKP
jgi:glyoxylase-like metal-dependent hydrolase (beta-lactamase superfamily II)